MGGHNLRANPLHLGLGARVTVEPAFSGDMRWFEDNVAEQATLIFITCGIGTQHRPRELLGV